MMGLLRQWLVGVACAAMIVALADGLTPKGTVKKIGRMAGGILLLLAVVRPLLRIDLGDLAVSIAAVGWESRAAEQAGTESSIEQMKAIIGEHTGAYILDKAAELGAECLQVEVECTEGTAGFPYPTAVTVTGTMTQTQREALSKLIEADLAIPRTRQTYESGGKGPWEERRSWSGRQKTCCPDWKNINLSC